LTICFVRYKSIKIGWRKVVWSALFLNKHFGLLHFLCVYTLVLEVTCVR